MNPTPKPVRRYASPRRGYSLVEMIVASASAAVLLGGMASSIYIASQAFRQDGGSGTERMKTAAVLSQLNADLSQAISFTELTAGAATFTVPDRDGDRRPETIRYAWSGTPGEPLTYAYNDLAPGTLADDVQSFNLLVFTRTMTAPPLKITPPKGGSSLLFVVTDPENPTDQETARQVLFEFWDYDVTMIAASESQTNFDLLVSISEVVYISEEIISGALGTKLKEATIGIVNEEIALSDEFGFSSDSTMLLAKNVDIETNSHYITEELDTGALDILTIEHSVAAVTGTLASGLFVLGRYGDDPALFTVSPGADLYGGGVAAGRRVRLPWGGNSFDVNDLTPEGRTLMRRAIEWAAGAGADPGQGVNYEGFVDAKLPTEATEISVPTPPGTQEGDLLIAAAAIDGNVTTVLTGPSGWNPITITDATGVTLGVWWTIAGPAEPPAQLISWSGGPSEQSYAWVMRFTGHDPLAPINSSSVLTTNNSDTPTSPAVTTTVNDALILRLGGFDDDDIILGEPGLLGHAAITMDASGPGNNGASGGAGWVIQPLAGASDDSNFELTAREGSVTVTIAIAPDQGE